MQRSRVNEDERASNEDERASEEQGTTQLYLRMSVRMSEHEWPSPRIGGAATGHPDRREPDTQEEGSGRHLS